MEKMRNCANTLMKLLKHRVVLCQRLRGERTKRRGLLSQSAVVDLDCRHQLADAVVQLAGDAALLFVAHLEKTGREFAKTFVRSFELRSSLLDLVLKSGVERDQFLAGIFSRFGLLRGLCFALL